MAVVIGDARAVVDVAAAPRDYRQTLSLAAGTHFLRVDWGGAAPPAGALVVAGLSIAGPAAGVSFRNASTDENALAAAATYAATGRRGAARVRLEGVPPGTPARARLVRHAFRFGVNAPGTTNRFLIEGSDPQSEAGRFQTFIRDHFNTLVPSNAGKWVYHEEKRGVVTMDYVDTILDYARRHGFFARMHTLIWDTEQQPAWARDLLTAAAAGDAAAKADLVGAIQRRIGYYVRDRARGYLEVDVINESLHKPRYVEVLGVAGVAEVFSQVARAAREGGGRVLGYANEYNVLQFSHVLEGGKQRAPDPYANWYRRHVEELRVAAEAGAVGGVGVQYYADARPDIEWPHSAARILEVLHNLSATGLPVTLTEFGVKKGAAAEEAARILEETMRLVFGTPGTLGFLMFGFWAGAIWDVAPEAVLVDRDWNLTEAGRRYERLMAEWSTDVTAPVGADGTLTFSGFYGDYRIEAGGKSFRLELAKGQPVYTLRAD
jgi:GH35 family endo-1,4-beta-xylanase